MFDKVNVALIVRDHFETLRYYRHGNTPGRRNWFDLLLFFGLPTALAVILTWFYGEVQGDLATMSATMLAVFAALLFNVLVFVYDRKRKDQDALRGRYLNEITSNVSFAILVALCGIITLMILKFVKTCVEAELTFSGVTYFLLALFILTLIMLLRRLYIFHKHDHPID